MQPRRLLATLAGASLVVAACGSGTGGEATGQVAPTPAPADPAATPSPSTSAATQPVPEATPADASGSSDTTAATAAAAPAPSPAPGSTAPPVEPTSTVAAVVWPDDGCNADNSPTATESAAGPAPSLEVRAESADSPLPDLAVRRINCNGGWVNLRNEIPSILPLLVWMWAPH